MGLSWALTDCAKSRNWQFSPGRCSLVYTPARCDLRQVSAVGWLPGRQGQPRGTRASTSCTELLMMDFLQRRPRKLVAPTYFPEAGVPQRVAAPHPPPP